MADQGDAQDPPDSNNPDIDDLLAVGTQAGLISEATLLQWSKGLLRNSVIGHTCPIHAEDHEWQAFFGPSRCCMTTNNL